MSVHPCPSFPSVQGEMQANSLFISSPSQNALQFVFFWPIWSSVLLTLYSNFSFRNYLYYGAWHRIFNNPGSNTLPIGADVAERISHNPMAFGFRGGHALMPGQGISAAPARDGMKGFRSSFEFYFKSCLK